MYWRCWRFAISSSSSRSGRSTVAALVYGSYPTPRSGVPCTVTSTAGRLTMAREQLGVGISVDPIHVNARPAPHLQN